MNLKKERQELLAKANALIESVNTNGGDFTATQASEVKGMTTRIREIDAQLEKAAKDAALVNDLKSLTGREDHPAASGVAGRAKSLGEHVVRTLGENLKSALRNGVAIPEFKAATDTHLTTELPSSFTEQVDRTIVRGYRQRPVIADLMGSGTLTGNTLSYFVEGALEGTMTTVAEGGLKPQLHIAAPTKVSDARSEIAGWIKVSDDMLDDQQFIMGEINNRLLYHLSMVEEAQILNGNGTSPNLRGLLQRSGLLTETQAATNDNNQDTVFRAMTKVEVTSGMSPDAIVMHPTNYQALRLSKDGNGQYFGGGFFTGPYGNGGVMEKPPVWGLRTVVTPAVALNTVVVGNFALASTLYRQGGVRVESTNSNVDDFINDKVTIRAKEYLALAVRYPAAFCKVTLL